MKETDTARAAILRFTLSHLTGTVAMLQSMTAPELEFSDRMMDECLQAFEEHSDIDDAWFDELIRQASEKSRLELKDAPRAFLAVLPNYDFTSSALRCTACCRIYLLYIVHQLQSLVAAAEQDNYLGSITAMMNIDRTIGAASGLLRGFGLNNKLGEAREAGARRAANGRRLIGTTSRERVRVEAEAQRHLSKSAASIAIASRVQLSVDRVRKILSDLYPRGTWGASSDVTGRDN